MFKPSSRLQAWTLLRKEDEEPLSQQAADILESVALKELGEAWIRGDLSVIRSLTIHVDRDPIAQLEAWCEEVDGVLPTEEKTINQAQVDQMIAERNQQQAAEAAAEEVGQAPDLGEIPKAFEGPRKLVHSQNLGKALKKYAEARELTLDALTKEMGWAKGVSNLRSILNKKGSVDTKYADFFVSLFGPEILSD